MIAQGFDALLDLDDSFGGREDERGEAFPVILLQQPQAFGGLDCGGHHFVFGEGLDHLRQFDVQLQIVPEPAPVGSGAGGLGVKLVSALR